MAASTLSLKERIAIVRLYSKSENAHQVIRDWHQFSEALPPDVSTVIRLNAKFDETGSVADLPRSGRARSARSTTREEEVLRTFSQQPTTSLRQASSQLHTSRSTISRILDEHGFYPYRATLVHGLLEDDFDRRVEFCQKWLDKLHSSPRLADRVIWSDESLFKLNGHVNRHNSVYWSRSNPHHQLEVDMNAQGLTVWAAMSSDGVIGPFFFDGTVNGANYLRMLQTFLLPAIASYRHRNELWFQQDGAPPHYALPVREWLSEHFPNRWLGRRGPVEWPPRSCDLSPPDFFLWGYLKELVYEKKPTTLAELRQQIITAFHSVTPSLCAKVCHAVATRLQQCLEKNGEQVL